MLAKRIIPCLDVRDGKVVKGTCFKDHEIVGDILDLATRYRDEGADELVFYDIAASADGLRVSKDWVSDVAKVLNIPFCVAGGIKSIADAEEILAAGADKISINSPAVANPSLINELARRFGQQCIVVGVDSMKFEDGYRVFCMTGREEKIQSSGKMTMAWLKEIADRGAGEVVLNCMDRDGTGLGYDIDQLRQARETIGIPLVASGGAKSVESFVEVFQTAQVDAALAARIFHSGALKIPDLKTALRSSHIEVRA